MSHSDKAILLRKVKYGEKNLILQTFTRDEGSKSYFLHSTRLKGKNKVVLPPLAVLEIVAAKGKGNLPVIREIQLSEKFYDLMTNLEKASIIMFLNEVLQKVIKEHHEDLALFDFVFRSLVNLEHSEKKYANFHLKFLLELSHQLGIYPNGQYSEISPLFDLHEGLFLQERPMHGAYIDSDMSQKFSELLLSNDPMASDISISNSERRALLSSLLDYYRIHIDRFDEVNSKEILENLFS